MTTGRRRRVDETGGVEVKEARTTPALVTLPAADVRATASLGVGDLETVAVASLGADFLVALEAAALCAELFFFFAVVGVVGVPDKSKPESSIAARKFEKRRMIK